MAIKSKSVRKTLNHLPASLTAIVFQHLLKLIVTLVIISFPKQIKSNHTRPVRWYKSQRGAEAMQIDLLAIIFYKLLRSACET